MKIILLTLILLGLNLQESVADPAFNIQYKQSSQTYLLPENEILGHELFSFFGLQSGLEIRFSPSLARQKYLLPRILSEQQLIRWLTSNLSTVEGFNSKNKLISLVILPKGEFQSDELIFANDPVNEGKAHLLGQTNHTAKQRFQLRVAEFTHKQQQQLDYQIEKNFEREEHAKKRNTERRARKLQRQSALVEQLRFERSNDPELYTRLLEVNKKRYPDLEAKVLSEASQPME